MIFLKNLIRICCVFFLTDRIRKIRFISVLRYFNPRSPSYQCLFRISVFSTQQSHKGCGSNGLFGRWGGNLADPVQSFSWRFVAVCRVSGRCSSSDVQRTVVFRYVSLRSLHKRIQFCCLLLSCSTSPKFPILATFFPKMCCHAMEVVSSPWLKGF